MITLIFCGDLKYCPYLSRYVERLENKRIEYEVLFWNRGSFELNMPSNYKFYNSPSPENYSKVRKMIDFWGFRRWVIKQISRSKPDRLVLLSTLSGFFLADVLKKYKKKYIFDIRDYSYEHISFFKRIEERLIKDSYFTAISSKGFKSFLPKYNYVIAHNFNRNEIIKRYTFKKNKGVIKFVWNGTIRFFKFQKKYIDALKNDPRFLMIYHGSGTDLEMYKSYCKENSITNVLFTGPYDNKNKKDLLSDADILNNCYGGSDGDQLRYAISNRYYDGLIYHIPQLVEPDGFKASVTINNEVGIALNATDSFADDLYEYYQNIDSLKFNESCDNALKEVLEEDDIYIANIDEFI